MALSIKDPEADKLARQLAQLRGISMTEAVVSSLRHEVQLEERKKEQGKKRRHARLRAIIDEIDAMPVYDSRTPDEILGYNEFGHFN